MLAVVLYFKVIAWEKVLVDGFEFFECIEGKWKDELSEGWWEYEGNEGYFDIVFFFTVTVFVFGCWVALIAIFIVTGKQIGRAHV